MYEFHKFLHSKLIYSLYIKKKKKNPQHPLSWYQPNWYRKQPKIKWRGEGWEGKWQPFFKWSFDASTCDTLRHNSEMHGMDIRSMSRSLLHDLNFYTRAGSLLQGFGIDCCKLKVSSLWYEWTSAQSCCTSEMKNNCSRDIGEPCRGLLSRSSSNQHLCLAPPAGNAILITKSN